MLLHIKGCTNLQRLLMYIMKTFVSFICQNCPSRFYSKYFIECMQQHLIFIGTPMCVKMFTH